MKSARADELATMAADLGRGRKTYSGTFGGEEVVDAALLVDEIRLARRRFAGDDPGAA